MAADKNSYKKSSFGPAFLFLEKHRREALADYYEFCRRMDDIADEPDVQNPAGELDFWADEIARVYDGRPETDLGKRLLLHVREFGITQDRFLMLIDGMRADLRGQTYTTFEELGGYMYRVAVIVGFATLDILGVKGPEADIRPQRQQRRGQHHLQRLRDRRGRRAVCPDRGAGQGGGRVRRAGGVHL